MIKVKENFQLKEYNTFGIEAKCNKFIEFDSIAEVQNILKGKNVIEANHFVLGGGSNVLFTKDFDGIIFYPNIKGIKVTKETKEHVFLEVGAGENWDSFVEHCVKKDYSGIENLSLIPGNVGATPVQNIGAYGVEVKDYIEEVSAININEYNQINFSNSQCNFNYRNSVFKNELKNQFIITHVTFRLNKKHNYITHYGNVEEELLKFDTINLSNIRKAILNIRDSKLPDHTKIGNAGSFFKNPIIENNIVERLQKTYPDIPVYKIDKNYSKLAAGWMIDKCGWKGKQYKSTGTYKDQALVLINYGKSSGKEIEELSLKIREDVYNKFKIEIEPEVNIL